MRDFIRRLFGRTKQESPRNKAWSRHLAAPRPLPGSELERAAIEYMDAHRREA